MQDYIAGCGSLGLDESMAIIASKSAADELAELAVCSSSFQSSLPTMQSNLFW